MRESTPGMTNEEIASAFHELADLLELAGDERFKILAYRRAAEEINALATDAGAMTQKELQALRGIGKATAAKVVELITTGRIAKLEEARAAIPAGVREMMDLPGLGPRKAMALHTELGIDSLEDLRRAVESQSLRAVPGFGPRTEESLGRALKRTAASRGRLTLDKALAIAESLIEEMKRVPSVERAEYAGSLRRMRETIGDIDLLVATTDPGVAMRAFTASKHAEQVIAHGLTKSSILTKSGTQIDLRAVAPDEFGSALQYFTGSKDHNVRVREVAVARGLKLSEYGVFRVGADERIASVTEEEVYAAIGLATPPPTMREDRGEVQLAIKGELPKLVEVSDLRGDLHMHTTRSDGKASLEEMARSAIALGYSYIAVTDHGLHVNVKTLSLEDIETQRAEIDVLNKSFKGFRILHGVELNIGADGGLDYDDDVLKGFDVVVASVHSGLTGQRK
ncbi:MAG TPA: helix-hairpin-helix domain-containing protein, partial [Actinomycetota bacterium]|nr:helix-hairpin-helix domain-containing protein [Actinomycetota bacterium]